MACVDRFRVAEIGKILGFDERIGRQLSSLAVGLELPIGLEVATKEEQLQQRVRLGNVVKIDLATIDAGLFQAVEDCRHIGKVRWIVVLMAVGGGGMDEPAVGPGLAWRRCEPMITDRKFLGELREHRHLGRCKIMHHAFRIVGLLRV